MKKSILFLAVATLGFAACTSTNSSSTTTPTTDSTVVDTAAVVDSTAVTATISYTNQAGTSGKTSQPVVFGGAGAIFVTAIWAGLFPELKNARTFEPQYRGKSP